MIFLYIPFLYTFHTRLLTLSSRIAWFFTYFFPVAIVCFYFELDSLFLLFLVFSIYSAYELGYIFNDCEVVKNEDNPTLRLSTSELKYYETNKIIIFTFRFLILIFINYLTFVFYNSLFESLFLTCILILLIYVIYNNLRNILNLPLYSVLVYLRYFCFFVFLEKSFILFLILYFVYPFCVTVEFSTKKRFITSCFIKIKNFDEFRSYYYFFVLVSAIALYFFVNVDYSDIYMYLAFYFFIYRLLSYIFLSKRIRNKQQ